MRVSDGEPRDANGLGPRPSHRPQRLAHTLRTPNAFPSLISNRIPLPCPTATSFLHPRDQLVAIMDRIYRNGMTTLSGGNLSIRDDDDSIWITPAGVDKGKLTPKDIICIRPDGTAIGPHRPSSELPFHRAIFARRPDFRAVVHAARARARVVQHRAADPEHQHHSTGAAGVRRGRLCAVRGPGQRGAGRQHRQHLRRRLQRRPARKPRHRHRRTEPAGRVPSVGDAGLLRADAAQGDGAWARSAA